MRIAVVGVGAVGGYSGGSLAHAGENVVCVTRGANLRSTQAHGLQVDSVEGRFVLSPAQATDHATKVRPVDVVLLTVKAWQVEKAIETVRPLMGRLRGERWHKEHHEAIRRT